jgi:DNA ligase (NAD+)
LGIPGVGVSTARDLAEHFETLDRVRSADERALKAVPDIGPTTARGVAGFFRRAVNRRIIDLCRRRGVQVVGSAVKARGPLAGKAVVFTGGLESMTREAAEEQARVAGGRTARSVGPATNLVVAGADPGSKYARARALGVRVIDERQFRRLVGVHQ